ncbi:MAG TPA: choice-of-anchor D domain-containing protein [Candidatus Kapabacteria bacterium]|jgi:hypothetical protein|nr:choice-of-anchor D domain-containing protein [Candidatus Kapabacteria bacterium]
MKYFLPFFLTMLFAFGLHSTPVRAQGATTIIPRQLTFPTPVTDGQTVIGSFRITNYDTVLSLHGHIGMPVTGQFILLSSDTFSLAPRQYDSVLVEFAPTLVGSLQDTITITHDGATKYASNPAHVVLSGKGISVNDTTARIQILSTTIVLTDTIGRVTTKNLIIKNITNASRYLYGTISGIKPPFSFVSGNGSFNIADSTSDTMKIQIAVDTVGQFIDTLTIRSNANAPDNVKTVLLYGNAIAPVSSNPPTMQVTVSNGSDGQMNFAAATGKDSIGTMTITNTSSTNSNLYDTLVAPTLPFSFTVTTLPSVIASQKSRSVKVQFEPTATGTFQSSITIKTNAQPTPQAVINLTGVAVAAGVGENAGPIVLSMMAIPNPASDALRIDLNATQMLRAVLALYDGAGNKIDNIFSGVVSEGPHSFEYSTRGLASGSYFIRLETGGSSIPLNGTSQVLKIIVRH